jgi:hypothetical protein
MFPPVKAPLLYFKLKGTYHMNNISAEQLLQEILEHAEEQPSEFRFITSLVDYRDCLRWYKATKIVIKILKVSSKKLYKAYCRTVTSGISDVTQLLAFAQLADVIAFYENELKTIYNMLDEYEEYLWQGNIFYALLGGERY